MKNHKHFGIFDPTALNELSKEEIITLLIDRELACATTSYKLVLESKNSLRKQYNTKFDNPEPQYRIKEEIGNEIYSFIRISYAKTIEARLTQFNTEFQQKTFGFTAEKKVKEIRKEFNKLVSDINDNIPFLNFANIFKKLFFIRKSEASILTNLDSEKDIFDLVILYLTGYDFYNNGDLYDSNEVLRKLIEFESQVHILVTLNQRYDFEKDDYLKPPTIAEKIYEEYKNEFESLKQVQFIQYQIETKGKTKTSEIISLFHFFTDLLMKKPSATEFRIIVNSYFNLEISQIKINSDNTNEKHHKRISEFQKQWLEFKN